MTNDKIELPEPTHYQVDTKKGRIELYTADQLRSAVEADRQKRAQAAEPVATMHVGMFGSVGFTGLDAGAKLPEGDYQPVAAISSQPPGDE